MAHAESPAYRYAARLSKDSFKTERRPSPAEDSNQAVIGNEGKKKKNPAALVTGYQTRIEQAEARTERAKSRAESAATRTEQAEVQTEQAATVLLHAVHQDDDPGQTISTGLLENFLCMGWTISKTGSNT